MTCSVPDKAMLANFPKTRGRDGQECWPSENDNLVTEFTFDGEGGERTGWSLKFPQGLLRSKYSSR